MKDNKKQYWKGIEQLSNDPGFVKNADKEFPDYLPIKESRNNKGEGDTAGSRRDFLKLMGFGVAAASLAACEAPIRKAIPYLNKPVEVDPGVANYYASTYINGGDYASVVVKTREGRPIKIEGNKLSKISQGGVSAQVEASVLSLYDNERLRDPLVNGEKADWVTVDQEVSAKLRAAGGRVRIVSNTVISPSTQASIDALIERFGGSHVSYDPYSAYGMLEANNRSFGSSFIPSYDFSKANTIVSFGADFLGTWISPIEFTKQYSKTRKIGKDKKEMSRHFHFESNLSLTGANADYRTAIKPSQEGLAVASLYNLLAARGGRSRINTENVEFANLEKAADELWAQRGRSIVVSGSNDVAVQTVINAINDLLGNYGNTIDNNTPVYFRKGNDAEMNRFIADAKGGNVSAVIFYNANPVYDHPQGAELAEALQNIALTVSTADRIDETASHVGIVAPDHHYLESWNDAEPKAGQYSLMQPTISPLFNTRQAQQSFLKWSGSGEDYFDFIRGRWRSSVFASNGNGMDFDGFWDDSLFNGILETEVEASGVGSFSANMAAAGQSIGRAYKAQNDGIELALYQKVGLGTGNMANNPWLHEMPDPVTKACWDNYVTISQSMASDLGIKMSEGNTSMVNLSVNGQDFKVPALVQPGQARGTVGLALGYGRTHAGKVGNEVGVNAYPIIVAAQQGGNQYIVTENVSIEKASESYSIAQTQTHQTYMGRETVIQESVLSKYKEDPQAGRYFPKIATAEGMVAPATVSLWGGHAYPNHHWGMAIDLNSCTGCSACTIACHAENNVPVVGKQEVLNRRDMHWMRIDRYYSSDADADDIKGLEEAAENPEVTFQPMMCQHCNNAPCETVCPVVATTHSTEGLNQMTYNRCIGTRYCANNCPYKVRRFNWFKYHDNDQFADNTSMNNDLGKMVLNPDVTVRARGVMEKCSLCVQRIQSGKLTAKKEGRRPKDGEITTACASSCPADALIFGDFNDPESNIVKLLNDEVEGRAYHVLEEINVQPNMYYLTKIRNKDLEEQNA